MANRTYAIMGATGHIGKILVETLLKKGQRVHALGRDKNKLQHLKEKGAEIFPLTSFDDSSALAKAFAGSDAVFSFLPPIYHEKDPEAYEDKVSQAIKNALIKTRVPFVLNLSSLGADLEEGTGPIKNLTLHEKRLNEIPNLNVLHLRPGYFMENLNWSVPVIKNSGILGSALRPDVPIQMIATPDIGLKAAEFLQALNFKGQTIFDFLGPKEITMEEAASAIGKAIGKPGLKYRQFSYQEAEKGMLEGNLSLPVIKMLIEMFQAFNEEKIRPTQKISPDHLGKTTIEEFALTSLAPEIMALQQP
jgi:uncharacterized protein YbjT (DUF2867 family)